MLKIAPDADRKRLVTLLADIVSIVEPRLHELWTTTGITFAQRRVLRRLREGPLSAGAIAADLGVSAPSVTRQLQRLEDHGLIVRAIDSDDRRRVLVKLTPAGKAFLADHKVFGDSPITQAAGDLSPREQRELARHLERFIRAARERAGAADD